MLGKMDFPIQMLTQMSSVKSFWLEVYNLNKKEQDLLKMSCVYRVLTWIEDVTERHSWLNLSQAQFRV